MRYETEIIVPADFDVEPFNLNIALTAGVKTALVNVKEVTPDYQVLTIDVDGDVDGGSTVQEFVQMVLDTIHEECGKCPNADTCGFVAKTVV